jgi:hypothetical protein
MLDPIDALTGGAAAELRAAPLCSVTPHDG